MLPELMISPELSGRECGKRIATSVKRADVWLQVMEHMDSVDNQ
jgi:hypothetical protein